MSISFESATPEELEATRNFNDLVRAITAQMPSPVDLEGLLAVRALGPLPGQEPLADTEVVEIPTREGSIVGRIRRPAEGPVRAVYLDIHGGGWSLGDPARSDQTNQVLSDVLGAAVVSIDYRLAPEHPWPAGADDCCDAAVWILEGGMSGVDLPLMLGGGSAGAHLALVTYLRLRDSGRDVSRIAGLNLINGAFDLSLTPSARQMTDALVIPTADIEALLEYTFPGFGEAALRDADISPLYADLAGLPPILVTVGTADPLVDDSLFLAARLTVAGSPVYAQVFPESIHGFSSFPAPLGVRATEFMHQWLCGVLDAVVDDAEGSG